MDFGESDFDLIMAIVLSFRTSTFVMRCVVSNS